MNWLKYLTILRQHPVVVFDYQANLNNGASANGAIPCEGYSMLYGMIYSDQAVTFTVEQGVKENAGTANYRHTDTIAVAAATAETFEIPIVGKFVKCTVSNASGAVAAIECYARVRGI